MNEPYNFEEDPEFKESEESGVLESETLGTGLHVITITYDDDDTSLPEVHLGDCSPWVASTLLKLALESVEVLLPPVNVSYRGDLLLSHTSIDEDFGTEEI